MTAKPTKTADQPVTQAALPADERFGNLLIAERDTAVVELHALQSQLAARNGKYERDMERLNAEHKADVDSLNEQIAQNENISKAADMAINAIKAAINMKEA